MSLLHTHIPARLFTQHLNGVGLFTQKCGHLFMFK